MSKERSRERDYFWSSPPVCEGAAPVPFAGSRTLHAQGSALGSLSVQVLDWAILSFYVFF